MQKTTKETTKKKLVIPYDVLETSGFQRGEPVDIHTLTDAAVILKNEMTAMELIHAVDQMQELSVKLLAALAENCESCEDCGESEDGACPYLANHIMPDIPADVRQEAGIPADAKLCAWAGPEPGVVSVAQARYRHDLSDVPEWVMEILAVHGVCFEDLAELIMSEDPVHV